MIRLKVKEIAKQQKISQNRLGRLADMDHGTVRRIYAGDANITLETLNRLARALHCHPCELLEYIPDDAQQGE